MSYVIDGTFATLSNRASRMYAVVKDVRAYQDNERCLKNQFYHSIKKLAELAGLSRPHAVYALKELQDKNIITREHRHNHSTLYTYIESIPKNPDLKVTKSNRHTVTKSNLRRLQNVTIEQQVLNRSNETTTDKDVQSYNYLCKKFSKEVVDVVVENCKKLNGDARNFWGLVHWSCQTGIPPTNQKIRQAEAKEKHIKFVEEETEKRRREQEENEKAYEESDPEVRNREIAKMMEMLK